MGEKLKNLMNKLKPVAADLEMPILVFPVVAVLIVAITFLIPAGKCGAWQWWSAVALTLAAIFARPAPLARSGLSAVSFLLFLGFVLLVSKLTLTIGWFDTSRYHLPAIRMMIEGWNPVWQGTFAGMESTGVSPEWLNPYHVISMPKGVWYFCASAYFFTHEAFNLFMPLMIFFHAAIIYSTLSALKGVNKYFKFLAIVFMIEFLPSREALVDGAVAVGGVGLLFEMYSCIKTGKWNILRLVVFTFWMAAAKQVGMLQAAVFWFIFISFNIFRKNWKVIGEGITAGAIAAMLLIVVLVSPFISSYANFGHPLYPKYTFDEENCPVVNITDDFFDRNDDAAEMGHLGAWVNAFVSSDAAKFYYKHKLGKEDFKPDSRTWRSFGLYDGSPTMIGYKFRFTISIAALLLLGGAGGLFLALCFIAGTFALPTEMIGYIRYTPWCACIFVFAMIVLPKIKYKWISAALFAAYAAYAIKTAYSKTLYDIATSIDGAYAIKTMLKENPPKVFLADCERRFDENEDPVIANLVLTKREVPELKDTIIISNPYDGVNVEFGRKEEGYALFYDQNCRVLQDCDLIKYSPVRAFESKSQPWHAKPKLFFRTYFITLPKAFREAIHG